MTKIEIKADSILINQKKFTKRPYLVELLNVLGECKATVVKMLTIGGKPGREFIKLEGLGIELNRYVPDDVITSMKVRLLPNRGKSDGTFEGSIHLEGATLVKGSRIEELLGQSIFKFDHQIAVTPGVALSYEPKFEFIESLVIQFPGT